MSQLRSEIKKQSQLQFAFISIFYEQEKWQHLLPLIKTSLLRASNTPAFLFFSSHRGSSIRLALPYLSPAEVENCRHVIESIKEFLQQNPSNPAQIQLPIHGFFADFPNNEIKFNLFNERTICPGGLAAFQSTFSQLLLEFFEDHPIDDEALFTLLVWMQDAILKGLCDPQEPVYNFILNLMSEMEEREFDPRLSLFELDDFNFILSPPAITKEPDLDRYFLWFGNAANLLSRTIGNSIETYFILIQIIREHLFKLPRELFVDSLHYLFQSLQQDNVAESADVF